MAVTSLKAGDVLYALKDSVSIFEGRDTTRTYQEPGDYRPFTSSIDGSIDYLDKALLATSRPLNAYMGDATPEAKRSIRVQYSFSDEIGVYTGNEDIVGGMKYYQVTVDVKATYGGGSEAKKTVKGWVRNSDVTNVLKDLDTAVDSGKVSMTAEELAAKKKKEQALKSGKGNTPDTNTPKAGTTVLYVLGGLILAALLYFGLRKSN